MDSFITGSFAKNNIFGDFIGLLSNYNIQGVYNIYTIDIHYGSTGVQDDFHIR
jgi:hypothetical protein